MFQRLFKYKFRVLLGLLLVGVLMLIRNYESVWFYDPFTAYFKSEFQGKVFPQYETVKLFMNWLLRYALNSVVSLAILYVIFQDISVIKFSALLYSIFLVFLLLSIFFLLFLLDESYAMALFYVRRFLIQPIFLLLFVAAFYYQNLIVLQRKE